VDTPLSEEVLIDLRQRETLDRESAHSTLIAAADDVRLATELPGWRRFPPAQEWLKKNAGGEPALASAQLRDVFGKFIEGRTRAGAGGEGPSQGGRGRGPPRSAGGSQMQCVKRETSSAARPAVHGALDGSTPC